MNGGNSSFSQNKIRNNVPGLEGIFQNKNTKIQVNLRIQKNYEQNKNYKQ